MPYALALRRGAICLPWLLLAAAGAAQADPPEVGSRGAVVADPVIPPPAGTPCVVQLYSDEVFNDFSLHDFTYAPPANCPGPYAKIVLQADFSVTTGRQFDRTANIWIGSVNLYFGTTQEPSAAVAPSWRIERDISDYASLLATAGSGKIDLGNVVNDTYTGIIHGSGQILFYPAAANWPAPPRRPDLVLPLSSGTLGGATDIRGDGEFSKTLTLPRNSERIFLDVIAQSQGDDEFWITCVPDELGEQLQSCGHTAFRETQVRIDGEPAGVAPVYPWLYTGAIDPGVWRPIPGVQTLAFEPWRVDLTPFAAKLNDGQLHTIALSVFNAGERFSMAANLLVYRDAGKAIVGGALTENTLAQNPTPHVSSTVSGPEDNIVAGVTVTSDRQHVLSGYVDTSRGRVTTTITQRVEFENAQAFVVSEPLYSQKIDQSTRVSTETRIAAGGRTQALNDERVLLLEVAYRYEALNVGAKQVTSAKQRFGRTVQAGTVGFPLRQAELANSIDNAGELLFAADGSLAARTSQRGMQDYAYKDPFGACYHRVLRAEAGAISAVANGGGCPGEENRLPWFDAFDNYASSIFGATVQLLP